MAPVGGPRRVFKMDIMAPCWIYEDANLEGVSTLEISVGNVPFNFQIGADIGKVSFVEPQTEASELVIFKKQLRRGRHRDHPCEPRSSDGQP